MDKGVNIRKAKLQKIVSGSRVGSCMKNEFKGDGIFLF